ncbi:MAG TPA: DUF2497 domain-containing protein [Stellaceae bacterium]|jgi:hypothetical protein
MSDSTEGKDQHEPSMEEILASIRRIISEDGDDAGGGEAAAPPKAEPAAPVPPAAAAAAPAPAAPPSAAVVPPADAPQRPPVVEADVEEDDSDVLLLTEEAVDEPPPLPPSVHESPLAVEDEPPPEPPRRVPELSFDLDPEPLAAAASAPMGEPGLSSFDDRLLSDRAAAASLAAMSELVSRRHREPKLGSLPMGNADQTLEDLTRELLRPILKSWLDDNLPQIVERIVREEIGRLALDAQRR